MTDICERLVRFAGKVCISTDTEVEAANTIEALRAELAEKDKQTKAMDDMLRETTHHFMRADLENRRLRAENACLKKALKPFADVADLFLEEAPNNYAVEEYLGRFRAARAAMGESDE